MVVIDTHAHAWGEPEKYIWKSTTQPSGATQIVYTVDDILEDMHQLGIDQSVIVATPIHGRGSPYTREIIPQYPSKFRGILVLDYFAKDIVEQINDYVDRDGILGVRLGARMKYGSLWQQEATDSTWIVDDELVPFWDALSEISSPQAHIFASPHQLTLIRELASRYPEITFVIDHLGMPRPGTDTTDNGPYSVMKELSSHSNIYVKVTQTPSLEGYPFSDIHQYIVSLIDLFGTERMIWGSDHIYSFQKTTPKESMEFLYQISSLSNEEVEAMLGDNFERLL